MTIFFCISNNILNGEKKMPAYFSIAISIKGADRYDGMYADFIDILQNAGMKFVSGTWEFMDEPLDSIIAWNEKKLIDKFELGYDEHYSNDYRQVFLDFHGFSEVRSFIMYLKEYDEFVFSIIIPEDELLKWDNGRVTYDPDIIQDLKMVISDIWKWECVSAIQTTLELSGDITHIMELENGVKPSILPLCVIPKEFMKYNLDENDKAVEIHRNGVLIENI
ncbi:hypothetical protein [Butyrivibrio sp. XPD2002]|uniref:hypothetical protein n=1 Tax=Butyrivibrio sp. XPD2002 TaxID=1280665 RepID=UPI0003F4AF14|nr:hypothetical protein [Butyrivibrio sp. XPD2002]